MKKYEIIQVTSLAEGNLVLNKEQSRRRAHLLKVVDGDIYKIIRKVQFKIGEVIGFDGVVSKGMRLFMIPYISPEDAKAAEDEEAKLAEEAKSAGEEEAQSSDLKQRVLVLHAEGKKPGEIGKALDIPHQTAAKIIREDAE